VLLRGGVEVEHAEDAVDDGGDGHGAKEDGDDVGGLDGVVVVAALGEFALLVLAVFKEPLQLLVRLRVGARAE